MTCSVGEVLDKIEVLDEIAKAINRGDPLNRVDTENIRDLLEEYRDVLLNTKVHI
jgi:NTP pyrophosphatase (non-canonical NTP hydrolase)